MATTFWARQRVLITLFMLALAGLFSGCNKPKIEDTDRTQSKLQEIQSNYDSGKNHKAAKEAARLVKDYPSSPYMERALMLQADSLYAKGDYYQAYETYDKILDQFGATDSFAYLIDRETDIAQRFLAGSKRRFWKIFWIPAAYEGLKILDDIDARWPGSEAGAKAIMLRADHYYRKGKFFEAEQEYHRIVVSYEKSCHFPRAMYQEAQSKYMQYEGIYYDTICLEEAVVLYNQFKERFPEKARSLEVDQRLAWIKDQQVQKEYEIADYYYRTGRIPQAVVYWNNVIEMDPQSEFAARSIENIKKAQ